MQWKREWKINGGNKSVWNCGTSDSRGVSILQTKNCPGEVVFDNTSSQNGRIIKCCIKTESAIYHISNIYANNSGIERKRLFESFHNYFDNFTDDSVDHYNILVGDFNCTLDKTIDRNPSHSRDDIGTKELLFLLSQYDLTDIWRDRYRNDKRYTFQRGNSKLRIDYIFCDKSLSNKVYNVGISHCPFSAHDLVSFKLKLDEIQRGPGIWIMNINTLKSVEFKNEFEIREWEKITDDKWILKILKEGLKLEVQTEPHWTGIKQTQVNTKSLPIILSEVDALLEKSAIETVPQSEIECKASDISRRLVISKYAEIPSCSRSEENTQPFNKVGVHCQSRKIIIDPSSVNNILRSTFQFQKGNCVTNSRQTDQIRNVNSKFNKGAQHSKGLFGSIGFNSIMHRNDLNVRLFMRPIQLHLLHYWKPSSKDLLCQIPFTLHLKSHLIWWLDRANTAMGRSFHQWSANITITTDASKTGFEGHMKGQICQGKWTETQQSLHINILELDAVHRTVQHFLPQLQGQNVLIKSDNTTLVQYVNKQGGTRSIDLCFKTWDLWKIAIIKKIVLRVAHIAGRKNILADQLSRNKIFPTEWTLNDQVVQTIFSIWGNPMIDLFASGDNHKAPVFCVWIPHYKALAVDALTISKENMWPYAFPPICLIPKVLKHMSQYKCRIILIAPLWSRRHWYTELLQKSIAKPINIPLLKKSSTSTKNTNLSSKPRSVQVNSMAAINRNFRDKGFSRDTRKLLRASWRSGTKQDYTSKFKKFNCWCSERKKDPYTANLADCADFLTSLYTSGFTISHYCGI
ncbi:unnamed protein product [Mytilus coruscus]|uniref:Endonuclease/exonuclease/phosphatase domain-containing protein n=1 Tax=Mytilus coruscus TaxID=42192 RepID=A0A6J8BUR1_MYTCO|nr:unnamed protein product [Mytilus coruscus]